MFAELLERRGATALRCPLVEIRDAPDPAPILAWIERFCAEGCDDLILLTGEGLRRLLACVDRHRPDLRERFVEQLGRVRKIARGPKPGRALRELGLKPDLAAAVPTTAGIIDALRALDLRGRRVGVQLYGTEPNRPLIDFLEGAGASAATVAPYRYADAADDRAVRELIDRLAGGNVDAIAFTSEQQVVRLARVAEAQGQGMRLRDGLERCCVAAVGPVVAAALRHRGVRVDVQPAAAFFMKPLASELVARLGPRP